MIANDSNIDESLFGGSDKKKMGNRYFIYASNF